MTSFAPKSPQVVTAISRPRVAFTHIVNFRELHDGDEITIHTSRSAHTLRVRDASRRMADLLTPDGPCPALLWGSTRDRGRNWGAGAAVGWNFGYVANPQPCGGLLRVTSPVLRLQIARHVVSGAA